MSNFKDKRDKTHYSERFRYDIKKEDGTFEAWTGVFYSKAELEKWERKNLKFWEERGKNLVLTTLKSDKNGKTICDRKK